MQILIIGCGSIGERHARVFQSLGARVAMVDANPERARAVAARYGDSVWFRTLKEARLEEFGAAVIATPADSHVSIGQICANAGLHLLMEKPLSTSLPGVHELIATCRQKNLTLAIGYVLRFHPALLRAREICEAGEIGRVLSLQAACAHHLPTSRPDYRQTYYASAAMGGGVIWDLSHELNYAEWLLGPLRLNGCHTATVPELEIPGEAIADIHLTSADGVSAHIHLHAADHNRRRTCHITGSKASLDVDLLSGDVAIRQAPAMIQRFECKSDRDSWYVSQAQDFLRAASTKERPRCTGEEGLETLLHCAEAIQMSTQA